MNPMKQEFIQFVKDIQTIQAVKEEIAQIFDFEPSYKLDIVGKYHNLARDADAERLIDDLVLLADADIELVFANKSLFLNADFWNDLKDEIDSMVSWGDIPDECYHGEFYGALCEAIFILIDNEDLSGGVGVGDGLAYLAQV